MRLHLTLHCRPGSRIPINYAYEFSAWIYKVLANADPAFATWLHEHGYTLEGNKRFKFFTFSQLQLQPPFYIEKEQQAIRIDSGKPALSFPFYSTIPWSISSPGYFANNNLASAPSSCVRLISPSIRRNTTQTYF